MLWSIASIVKAVNVCSAIFDWKDKCVSVTALVLSWRFPCQRIHFGFWDTNSCVPDGSTGSKPQVIKLLENYWTGIKMITINVIPRSPFCPSTSQHRMEVPSHLQPLLSHNTCVFDVLILALVATIRSSTERFRQGDKQLCRLHVNSYRGRILCRLILICAYSPVTGSIFCRAHVMWPVSGHDLLRVGNVEDGFDTPVISELWKL